MLEAGGTPRHLQGSKHARAGCSDRPTITDFKSKSLVKIVPLKIDSKDYVCVFNLRNGDFADPRNHCGQANASGNNYFGEPMAVWDEAYINGCEQHAFVGLGLI